MKTNITLQGRGGVVRDPVQAPGLIVYMTQWWPKATIVSCACFRFWFVFLLLLVLIHYRAICIDHFALDLYHGVGGRGMMWRDDSLIHCHLITTNIFGPDLGIWLKSWNTAKWLIPWWTR